MAGRRTTVQWQIMVRQLPLLVVLFVVVLIWLSTDLETRLLTASEENARRSSVAVISAVEASMRAEEGHEVWDRVVRKLPLYQDTEIDIFDSHGTVVFSTEAARRGAVYKLTDPFCARCHEDGSPDVAVETALVRGPDREDFQVFASPLRNTEDCRGCHSGDGRKLGMVVVRQSLAPIQAQVRSVQVTLLLVGLIALALTMATSRWLLNRYLGRPLDKLMASADAIGSGNLAHPIELSVQNELSVLADTLNSSSKKLAAMVRKLEQQRDDTRTLYGVVDQLSRGVHPGERRRRGVELASKILNRECLLIRRPYSPTEDTREGIIVFRKNGAIVECPYSADIDPSELPDFYSQSLGEQWYRGELDDRTEVRLGNAIAYPLSRGGQALGLLLSSVPSHAPDEDVESAPDQEIVQALCRHLAIALEFSNLQHELLEEERLAAIGETVAGLAHWLKNVLNGLRAGQYVIDRAVRLDDMAKLRKGWDVMKKSIRQVEKLTSDVLYCTRARVPDRGLVSPNAVVEAVAESMVERATEQGVRLTTDLDETVPNIMMDRSAIQRALLNLVSNAIEACYESESGNLVTIRSRASGDSVVLTVIDNGIGMSDAVRKKLFQRFFSTKGSKGTGLGLMVTSKIIEEHGGSLQVESERGLGSSFQLSLPVESPEAAASQLTE